jgi:hypothetical protein
LALAKTLEGSGIREHEETQSMANDKPDKKYNLTVNWKDEDPYLHEFPVANTVRHVRDGAGKHFKIQPADLEKYTVLWVRENNTKTPLAIDSKLSDVTGLGDGAVLELNQPNTGLGG